jgi:hypothetical protein
MTELKINFTFQALIDAPIIDVNQSPQLEGNVNGPSLIKVPGWVKNPMAIYYLYFAHHRGKSIRLALADKLTGPWTLSEAPALDLANSLFPIDQPAYADLDEQVKQDVANGDDGNYPHIASPDVIVDEECQQIRLYYHGRLNNGTQVTRVALSDDGLNFVAQPGILGGPYFRTFRLQDYIYAMAMPGVLYRSKDGLSDFEIGPTIINQAIRHFAFLEQGGDFFVFWTRVGDVPERILCSTLLRHENWHEWTVGPEAEIHRPLQSWEGSRQPLIPSRYGESKQPANQLRDPAIYAENNRIYLLYAIAGEQGIAIGELTLTVK